MKQVVQNVSYQLDVAHKLGNGNDQVSLSRTSLSVTE